MIYQLPNCLHNHFQLAVVQRLYIHQNRWVHGRNNLHLVEGFFVNAQKIKNTPEILDKVVARGNERITYTAVVVGIIHHKIPAHVLADRYNIVARAFLVNVAYNVDSQHITYIIRPCLNIAESQ